MYGHFLRNESGRGDTIDRLDKTASLSIPLLLLYVCTCVSPWQVELSSRNIRRIQITSESGTDWTSSPTITNVCSDICNASDRQPILLSSFPYHCPHYQYHCPHCQYHCPHSHIIVLIPIPLSSLPVPLSSFPYHCPHYQYHCPHYQYHCPHSHTIVLITSTIVLIISTIVLITSTIVLIPSTIVLVPSTIVLIPIPLPSFPVPLSSFPVPLSSFPYHCPHSQSLISTCSAIAPISFLVLLSSFPFPHFPCVYTYSIYFKVVLHEGKKELISDLFAVIIERVLCLYNNKSFQDEVRK